MNITATLDKPADRTDLPEKIYCEEHGTWTVDGCVFCSPAPPASE